MERAAAVVEATAMGCLEAAGGAAAASVAVATAAATKVAEVKGVEEWEAVTWAAVA
jgi:hypothetical protein